VYIQAATPQVMHAQLPHCPTHNINQSTDMDLVGLFGSRHANLKGTPHLAKR
jgi:hypothetical protein